MKLFKKKNKVQSKPKIQKTLTTPTTAVVKKREQEPEKLNYEVLSIPISYIDHRYQQHNHHQQQHIQQHITTTSPTSNTTSTTPPTATITRAPTTTSTMHTYTNIKSHPNTQQQQYTAQHNNSHQYPR